MKLNTRGYVSGFSLLELLVALAIVAILAGLAWPGYQQWVCQSRRGAAINQLLTLQLRQEAYKVEQGQFSTSLAALGPASDEHYDYALNTTATGYLLTAYAKAASPQRSDQGCQRLTLDVDAQRWPPACWP